MLKNFWYACHRSAAISSVPTALELLGRRFVLFRGQDGRVAALDDRCPHRGAALSRGSVEAGLLVCPYHGWRFDGHGRCLAIPAQAQTPEARIPERARVPAHDVEERHGLVWLFIGDLPPAERPPIPPLPEYGDPRWRAIDGEFLWQAHYTRVVENGLDFAHAPFVHRNSFGNPERPQVDDYKVELGEWSGSAYAELVAPPPGGLWSLFLPKQRPPVKTRITFYMPNLTRLDLELAGGKMKMVIFSTNIPIDERRTLTRWTMLRSFFTGAWADANSRKRTHQIFLEDQPIVESQRPFAAPEPGDEISVKSDAMPLAYRKLVRQCHDRGWTLPPAPPELQLFSLSPPR
jgi:phenylpropionate dioxygenase-like ring-hydroxylating dioxygenase large terminal subunit